MADILSVEAKMVDDVLFFLGNTTREGGHIRTFIFGRSFKEGLAAYMAMP